jgi:hypothetical protein
LCFGISCGIPCRIDTIFLSISSIINKVGGAHIDKALEKEKLYQEFEEQVYQVKSLENGILHSSLPQNLILAISNEFIESLKMFNPSYQ